MVAMIACQNNSYVLWNIAPTPSTFVRSNDGALHPLTARALHPLTAGVIAPSAVRYFSFLSQNDIKPLQVSLHVDIYEGHWLSEQKQDKRYPDIDFNGVRLKLTYDISSERDWSLKRLAATTAAENNVYSMGI